MKHDDHIDWFWSIGDTAIFWLCKCASMTLRDIVAPAAGLARTHISLLPYYERCIVFVRDPVQRLASCWRDKMQGRVGDLLNNGFTSALVPDGVLYDGMSAAAFLEVVLTYPMANRHWIPVISWAHPALEMSHEIVRFEDLPYAWDRLGISHWPAEISNESTGPPQPFTADEVAKIRIAYAGDVALGSYEV